MKSCIDKVLYINLEKRTDRREQIESELRKAGFNSESIERVEAIYEPRCSIGCSKSQILALNIAIEKNYGNILIIEDDAVFKNIELFQPTMEKIVTDNIDFDIIGLGITYSAQFIPTKMDYLNNPKTGNIGVGYIVNCKFIKTLLDRYKESLVLLQQTGQHWNYAIDSYLKSMYNERIFVTNPTFITQRESHSDLAGKIVNYKYV